MSKIKFTVLKNCYRILNDLSNGDFIDDYGMDLSFEKLINCEDIWESSDTPFWYICIEGEMEGEEKKLKINFLEQNKYVKLI